MVTWFKAYTWKTTAADKPNKWETFQRQQKQTGCKFHRSRNSGFLQLPTDTLGWVSSLVWQGKCNLMNSLNSSRSKSFAIRTDK
jgi:hypothetical protein